MNWELNLEKVLTCKGDMTAEGEKLEIIGCTGMAATYC